MQNSFQYLVFSIIAIVVGATAEELLPKFLGVGFPILLMEVYGVAERRPPLASVLFAIAAGGVSDSLSSLPQMTSSGFFLLTVLLVRVLPFPWLVAIASYPLYQVWLALWTSGVGGEVYARVLLAIPMGAAVATAVRWLMAWAESRAAVDEAE